MHFHAATDRWPTALRNVAAVITVSACFAAPVLAGSAYSDNTQQLHRQTLQAMALHRSGRTKAAIDAFESIAEKSEAAFGPKSLKLARALNNLAIVYDMSGQMDRAEQTYRRALLLVTEHHAGETAQLAELNNNLAAVILQQCRIDAAYKLYRHALQLSEQSLGATHRDSIMVRQNVERLGRYLNGTGSISEPGLAHKVTERTSSNPVQGLLQRCLS